MNNTPDSQAQIDMGRRLKLIRDIRGLIQDDLADAIGISKTGLSARESGRNKMDVVALGRVAQILGCTTDYIIIGDQSGLRFELVKLIQARSDVDAPPATGSRRGRPKRSAA